MEILLILIIEDSKGSFLMCRRGIIDRFEGDYAVVEFGEEAMINIEISRLPADAKEGDIICIEDNGRIIIDHIETENRKRNINNLMDRLFE